MLEEKLLEPVQEDTFLRFITEWNRDAECAKIGRSKLRKDSVLGKLIDDGVKNLGGMASYYENAAVMTYELLRLAAEAKGKKLPVISEGTKDSFVAEYNRSPELHIKILKTISEEDPVLARGVLQPAQRAMDDIQAAFYGGAAGVYGLLRKQAEADKLNKDSPTE